MTVIATSFIDSIIFLSTSFSDNEASDFAKRGSPPFDMQRILTEIILNTSTPNVTYFVEIQHHSRHRDEHEVLFNCNDLFNLTSLRYDEYSEI